MEKTYTLEQAREILEKGLERGTDCLCCGRFTKTYKRKLNSGMAKTLQRLSIVSSRGFIHVKDFLRENKYKNSHDWTLLVHWGLLEANPEVNAEWKVTPKAKEFLKGSIKVPKHIIILNNKLLSFGNEEIGIKEALGEDFDYYELMSS